ncbi:hypothetical protein EB1_19470 [Empedobacter brevis NBRC 14943 = ATCC 43319]|uniref:DinB-like domain-containing protein n=1 Tax=Empedobacter brevis NBRC 14943 = ATCC 43319 TaxID=1218108 RepID=A0A511NHK8_9FLAO|nr:hypothetical protein [Empedobacter brevis]GEM52157.1 hypothetical protein EB1_19470 [Empedobacter brevis NBRC 14943 = ATCC 43319]
MSIQKTISHSFDEMKFILLQFDDTSYQKELNVISNASVGQHFRHIIEFYDCFIDAQKSGYICYDDRKRNRILETSVVETLRTLNNLKLNIERLNLETSIQLRQNYYGENFTIPTTNYRELMYCFDHSVHHFALIKIAIGTHLPAIKIPHNFGVASSTIAFQNLEK